MSQSHPTAPADPVKPAKPSPDFPLFPHAAGIWATKISGKLRDFGPWSDPNEGCAGNRQHPEAVGPGDRRNRPLTRTAEGRDPQ